METKIENAYPTLFAHSRMIADLLRGYVRASWLERLDLASLERRPEPAAGGRGERREESQTWRLRRHGHRAPLYLLLELPAAVDPYMALRLRTRLCLLGEELAHAGHADTPRPPRLAAALPVVLYHGAEPWTAPRQLAELFVAPPRGLERYEQRMEYLLLDALREPVAASAGPDNLVSLLFALERSRSLAAIHHLAARLAALLADPVSAGLRHAFTAFVGASLLPRQFPGLEIPVPGDLAEVGPRLRAAVAGWIRGWREQGRAAGRRQGGSELLAHQLAAKFGPLAAADRARLAAVAPEQLLRWGERLLAAGSLAEVFAE
jgi:putative YhgA-like transposase